MTQSDAQRKVAFAVAAHPDDIEFVMSGTLMHLKEAGYELHYMNVANGCCGTTEYSREEIAKIRREEGFAAASYLGATFHESLTNDLEIFYDKPTLQKLASVMREVRPGIVLTHSPVDYMEDHVNTCRLVVTALFARGMPNFEVTPPRAPALDSAVIYHAQPYGNQDGLRRTVEADLFVDVSRWRAKKAEMLALHQSQKRWLDESQGLDSYIHSMHRLDEEVGKMSSVFSSAEGWRRHLHLGFAGADADPLRDALGAHVFVRRNGEK
jgi:LmbE family N-acetylglucosaminyl deacetylase